MSNLDKRSVDRRIRELERLYGTSPSPEPVRPEIVDALNELAAAKSEGREPGAEALAAVEHLRGAG